MTALTGNLKLKTRGGPSYGYFVAPGVHVYAGAIIALNAAQQIVRPQDTGAVAFAGIASSELDNSTSAVASTIKVVGQLTITVQLNVPAATTANRGASVYATDDATLTLTNTGSLLLVGTLAGFDNGTWVKVSN